MIVSSSPFAQLVTSEYLKFFKFSNISLINSLRLFLSHLPLTGESQAVERVMEHFSNRYHESNPDSFESSDMVYGIICAVLLLSTDLHKSVSIDHVGVSGREN